MADDLLLQGAPFLRREATSLGISERTLRSTRFRTVLTGVLVDARVPDTVVVRGRAVLLVAPEGGIISHWTAARLWGGVVPDNEWTHISFMRDVRFRVSGVKPHRFRHHLDITRRHGLPVTSPLQTFCHLAKHLGLVDLVALGDRLVKKNRFSTTDLVEYTQQWQGQCRGDAYRAAALVRGRVDSVPESVLRVLMVMSGLPEPQVDIRLWHQDGRLRFRIDLGYEEIKLAVEYDGRWHDTAEQRAADTVRRSELEDEGWTFVLVTVEDLYDHPDRLIIDLTGALRGLGAAVPDILREDWRRHFRVAGVVA